MFVTPLLLSLLTTHSQVTCDLNGGELKVIKQGRDPLYAPGIQNTYTINLSQETYLVHFNRFDDTQSAICLGVDGLIDYLGKLASLYLNWQPTP